MKKKVFKVGDRVGYAEPQYNNNDRVVPLRYEEDDPPAYGVVTAVTDDNVIIKWDATRYDAAHEGNLDLEDQKSLYPEEELKKKWSKLEEDFTKLEVQVVDKVKAAGKLLREANKIAKKTGHSLEEMYDAISPLMDAMDDCGWNTSSFGC
jgi:hypothetical protein